jgi:hypothetical protein
MATCAQRFKNRPSTKPAKISSKGLAGGIMRADNKGLRGPIQENIPKG